MARFHTTPGNILLAIHGYYSHVKLCDLDHHFTPIPVIKQSKFYLFVFIHIINCKDKLVCLPRFL